MGLLTALLIVFLSLAALNAGFCNGGCIERERQALLKLKQDLVDPAGRLASWTADDEDCCRWKGVVCDNVTSHVLELCLKTPTLDFFTTPIDLYEANERSKLGGKISSSLLNLKHLLILDLSNNDFGGIYIPKFVGSLKSLRVLNLFDSGFGGEVPHHLGNLSSLEYLGLSSVSFSKASNWFYFVNTLPSSLVELRMSFCGLGPYDQVHPIASVNLSSLVVLDLSSNFITDLSMVKWVFGLRKLISFDLSANQLEGPIPHDLQNLTLLRHLDLSSNEFNSSTPDWLDNFSNLEFLDLSGNNFTGEISIRSIRKLCNLSFLSFSSNGYLSLKISHVLGIFSAGCVSNSLERLFLNNCGLSGQLTNQLGNFKFLRELDVSYNGISGPIPTSIGELQYLEHLTLSTNELSGSLPESFGQLKILRELYLSDNSLSGPIPTSIGELQSLNFLDLARNTISGGLPESFGQLANLEEVYISENSFDGSLPESFGQLTNLKYVYMSHNSFKGSLPKSFGQLVNMELVDMSYNSLEGTVSEIHFVKLKKLRWFYAHGNSLMILKVDSNWIPHFQIRELTLGSWRLGPQFPQWLFSQKYLSYLDISDSKIVDTVPNWFWELSSQCGHLNISNNQLRGHLPNMLNSSSPISPSDVVTFDFSSNNFVGPLSRISSNLAFLDLSKNNLSGSLFHFLCHERNESMAMMFLNLGQNFLSGELSDCWTKWPNLLAIVLSNNRLTGGIPRSMGTLPNLLSLHLQKNHLSGEIPLSLSNCTKLEVLQLSENELEGNIPPWMGRSLSSLIILILGSNEFSGHIPNELCLLTSLQILDLAHNNLFGTLPRCIGNISVLQSTKKYFDGFVIYSSNARASKFDTGVPYLENAFVLIKGQLLKYQKMLHLVKIMDFSENGLSGEIPSEIAYLQGLLSLNLSHNLFTGRIPENIGNLTMLESADFSWNKLFGSIPKSMASLTFLSYLNLSNNQLTGQIPSGTQLQSFNASSYAGNKLCGLPLPDNCSVKGNSVPSIQNRGGEDGNRVEINWFFVSLALGFIVGFWSVLSPLVISRRWRYMYYQFLEEMWWKISDAVNKYF